MDKELSDFQLKVNSRPLMSDLYSLNCKIHLCALLRDYYRIRLEVDEFQSTIRTEI